MNNKSIIFLLVGISAFLIVVTILEEKQTNILSSSSVISLSNPIAINKSPVLVSKVNEIPVMSQKTVNTTVKNKVNDTFEQSSNALTEDGSIDIQNPFEKRKILNVRRVSLNNIESLKVAAMDKNPEVRSSVVDRYRDLESEYEIEKNIIRNPEQSGKFVRNVLENISSETDSFVLEKKLDYFTEYGGKMDSNIDNSIKELIKRPDLSANVLGKIAQLQMDNYNVSVEQIKLDFQNNPSTLQMQEAEKNHLNEILQNLVNERSQQFDTSN